MFRTPARKAIGRRVGLQPLFPWLKKRGVEDRPEVDDPPEQDKPEDCRQTKLDDRHHQSALKQLPQAGDEETAECGENVAR